MVLTPLQRHWSQLAKQHRLDVDIPFRLQFRDGVVLLAEVRLSGYGGENGMLLVSDYSVVADRSDEIIEMGYGYSCLSQPQEDSIGSDESLADLLDDWRRHASCDEEPPTR